MSYGPIWYEWRKRPVNSNDSYEVLSEGNTHTRYYNGSQLVTEVYWCQPGHYHGAPGCTSTKVSKLIATIYRVGYATNDESGKRVYVQSYGFMEYDILQKAIEYALLATEEPGTDCPNLAKFEEYVPGKEYPCDWCGRSAGSVCEGWTDPKCVNKAGEQHCITDGLRGHDKSCHATCVVRRKDGSYGPWKNRCYAGAGHAGPHKHLCNLDTWEVTEDWTTPSDEEITKKRQEVLDERTRWVARHKKKEST
jgi:hypothetical protein